MVGFFARHEKNKGVKPENKGKPYNDKGHVAWLLWGGDPGKAWCNKVKEQMEAADKKSKQAATARIASRYLTVSAARVAARHVEADLSRQMDSMCRLSVLEGAAGATVGSWTSRPPRWGAAKEWATANNINDSWISGRGSNLWRNLVAQISTIARGIPDISGEDIAVNLIMGIGADGNSGNSRLFYEVGKRLKDGIKKGKETPSSASNLAVSWGRKRAITYKNTYLRRNKIMGPTINVSDNSEQAKEIPTYATMNETDQWSVLTSSFLARPGTDRFGDDLRRFMRNSWSGKSYEKYMIPWLDKLEKTGRRPRSNELARELGVSAMMITKAQKSAFKDFRKAFDRDRSMQRKLDKKLRTQALRGGLRLSTTEENRMEDKLKQKLIRLAYENPGEIREALLPMIREAGDSWKDQRTEAADKFLDKVAGSLSKVLKDAGYSIKDNKKSAGGKMFIYFEGNPEKQAGLDRLTATDRNAPTAADIQLVMNNTNNTACGVAHVYYGSRHRVRLAIKDFHVRDLSPDDIAGQILHQRLAHVLGTWA
jgi:hypothetical protein